MCTFKIFVNTTTIYFRSFGISKRLPKSEVRWRKKLSLFISYRYNKNVEMRSCIRALTSKIYLKWFSRFFFFDIMMVRNGSFMTVPNVKGNGIFSTNSSNSSNNSNNYPKATLTSSKDTFIGLVKCWGLNPFWGVRIRLLWVHILKLNNYIE